MPRLAVFGAGSTVAVAEKVQGVQGLLVEPYVCVRASRV
jgi:hypothetical protein